MDPEKLVASTEGPKEERRAVMVHKWWVGKVEKARQTVGVENGKTQYLSRSEGGLSVDLWARGSCDQC